MSKNWKGLGGFPTPLLVQTEFQAASYTIWLTDLNSLWTETLDRKQIVKRSLDIETSIDPSEDASQMRAFLSHIEKVFSDDPSVLLSMSSEDGASHITMSIEMPLPSPLPVLQWHFKLSKCPQNALAEKIILPLFASRLRASAEKDSLVSQIHEKDVIISKLIDQMQHDGLDISLIFPGGGAASKLAGKKNVREALGKSIKGMAEFNEDRWQTHIQQPPHLSDEKEVQISGEAVNTLLSLAGSPAPNGLAWWESSRGSAGRQPQVSEKQKRADTPESLKRLESKSESSQESRSQAQSTSATLEDVPSDHPLSFDHKDPHKMSQYDGSTTEDSDENDDDDARKPPSDRATKGSGGSPGGVKESQEELESHKPQDLVAEEDESKAGSLGVQHNEVPSRKNPQVKTKSKIGKIGGKKKVEDEEGVQLTTRPRQPELCSKGNTNQPVKDCDTEHQSPSPNRGRQHIKGETSTPHREDSVERADRIREKLKRELDQGQAARKKKRKF